MSNTRFAIFAVAAVVCVLGVSAVQIAPAAQSNGAVDIRGGKETKRDEERKYLSNAMFVTANLQSLNAQMSIVPVNKGTEPNLGLDLCPTCISFVSQSINQLIQIIANGGVVGGCAALCGLLPNPLESKVCNLLCDVVGIKLFIDVLGKVDLDPFYACELFKVCKTVPDGAANFTPIETDPTSAPQGTEFQIMSTLNVTSDIGCGELIFAIQDPEGNVLGNADTFGGLKANLYNIGLRVDTQPSDQQGGEQWPSGQYAIEFVVCQGECGSHHPGSEVYDVKTGKFSITGEGEVSQIAWN